MSAFDPRAPRFATPPRPTLVVVALLAVFLPAIIKLLLIALGSIDAKGELNHRLSWWGLVVSMTLVFVILRLGGERPSSIGLGRPKSWGKTVLMALGVTVAATLMAALTQAVMAPLASGAAADISRFDGIVGNPTALAAALASAWFTGAFGEEIIWRGFLLSRMELLFGDRRATRVFAVFGGGTFFGLIHVYQGPVGMAMTGVIGVVLGFFYYVCGRNLWVLILAHGLQHLMSFTAIYLGRV